MPDLKALIDALEAKIAALGPSPGHEPYDAWRSWYGGGDRLVEQLEAEFGARIRLDRDPATISLGGARASSTDGWPGLFRNWTNAARRRLEQRES